MRSPVAGVYGFSACLMLTALFGAGYSVIAARESFSGLTSPDGWTAAQFPISLIALGIAVAIAILTIIATRQIRSGSSRGLVSWTLACLLAFLPWGFFGSWPASWLGSSGSASWLAAACLSAVATLTGRRASRRTPTARGCTPASSAG
jgi:hypothetical protein